MTAPVSQCSPHPPAGFDGSGTVAPYRLLLVLLLPLYTAVTAAIQGVQQILVPAQVEAINPATKIASLGTITAIAAVTAMIGLLAGGIVSDRTSGRWGRRAPSLAVSGLIAIGVMLTMSAITSMTTLATVFATLWFTLNFYLGALSPALPDRVPATHRGIASSIVAVATPLGVIVGVTVASQLTRFNAYVCLAVAFGLATAAFLRLAPEPPALAPAGTRAGAGFARVRAAGHSLLSAFRSRDFSLVFAARALMFFSVWNVTGYLYFITQDFIGPRNLPGHDPQVAVSILLSVQMVACMLSAAGAGVLADRIGRIRLIVAISSIGIALSLVVPILAPTWAGMIAMELCVGLFFGAYLAVDLALMTLVLPSLSGGGKDMAILNIATGGPQILSPITGAALIATFGYSSLFAAGSLIALCSGVLILFVKTAR